MLRMAGIPPRRADRAGRNYPLIIAGGSAIFLNPEPIADYIDLFLIGEGEEMVPEFLAAYQDARASTGNEAPRLHDLARVEGAYLPDYFTPRLDAHGRIESVDYTGPGTPRVKRRLVSDLDRFSTSSLILTEESVFGDMYPGRSQPRMPMGMPVLRGGVHVPSDSLSQSRKDHGRGDSAACRSAASSGWSGAEMASVPGVAEIATAVADAGGRLSPSSLKADCVSPKLAAALARGGARSVTVAPEAGSERMRKVINKNLTESEILNAAEMLIGGGVESLKLYFMIGLPEERDEDVIEIANLTGRILERARSNKRRVGHVTVSLNPFVPKPWTPFQWDPMEDAASVKRKIALLRAALGRIGGASIELNAESPREAYFQTLVSRGDRRVGPILERLSERGCDDAGAIWHELRAIKREVGEGVTDLPNPDFYVTRQYTHDEVLPWDFIDHHIHKWFLLSERKKAHYEHQTKPCDVTRCTVCGAC